jgi:hypothetical protein
MAQSPTGPHIYLATPYSATDHDVETARADAVTRTANRLMRRRRNVISPITHGHALAALGGLPMDFAFWEEHCLSLLERWADELWVLRLPGWRESRGVTAEIATAKKCGIPIRYIDEGEDEPGETEPASGVQAKS